MIISLRVCPGTVLFTDKDTAQDIGRYFNRAIAWISVIKTLCAILIPCAMVRVKTLNYSSVSFKRRSNSVVTLFGKWYVYDSVAKCTYSMFSLSTAKIASGFISAGVNKHAIVQHGLKSVWSFKFSFSLRCVLWHQMILLLVERIILCPGKELISVCDLLPKEEGDSSCQSSEHRKLTMDTTRMHAGLMHDTILWYKRPRSHCFSPGVLSAFLLALYRGDSLHSPLPSATHICAANPGGPLLPRKVTKKGMQILSKEKCWAQSDYGKEWMVQRKQSWNVPHLIRCYV